MALLSLVLVAAELAYFTAGQQGSTLDAATGLRQAMALAQPGQSSEARQLADEVRAGTPSEGRTQNELGKVYEKLRDLQMAQEAYQRAIQLRPEAEDYYLDLTSLLFLRERPREAISLLTNALQKLPHSYPLRVS